MDKKIKQNIILILLLINLTSTGGLAVYLFAGSESQDAETAVFHDMETKQKYTLYIGTKR